MRALRAIAPIAAAAALTLLQPDRAEATEQQWRLGADGVYGMAGLPEATVAGLGAGLRGTYGLSDAINLRAGSDVTAFPLPQPARLGWMWSTTVGAEYVIDILDWVPTLAVLAGPMGIYRQGDGQLLLDRHDVYLGLEIPLGLGYQVTSSWALGVEGRYRTLLVGSDVGPINYLDGRIRAEYAWDD